MRYKTVKYSNLEIDNILKTAEETGGDISSLDERVTDLEEDLSGKQDTLVSGTNIKTINDTSVLGSGNIAINEFPEASQEDASLSQIAGVNSNGDPDVGKVEAANINSGSATNGQVLTADGNGGAGWANAGGGSGGTQLYKHTIVISGETYELVAISTVSNAYTNEGLATIINEAIVAKYRNNIILGYDANWEDPTTMNFYYLLAGTITTVTKNDFTSITDTVTAL